LVIEDYLWVYVLGPVENGMKGIAVFCGPALERFKLCGSNGALCPDVYSSRYWLSIWWRSNGLMRILAEAVSVAGGEIIGVIPEFLIGMRVGSMG
jgi:hypothetical protein